MTDIYLVQLAQILESHNLKLVKFGPRPRVFSMIWFCLSTFSKFKSRLVQVVLKFGAYYQVYGASNSFNRGADLDDHSINFTLSWILPLDGEL